MSSRKDSFSDELRLGGWRRLFASNLLRTGGAYLVLGNALELLLGFTNQFMLTRLLEVEEYGWLAWLGTVVTTLGGLFAFSGLSNTLITAIASGKGGNFRVALRYKLLGGAATSVILGAFACHYWVFTEQKAVAMLFSSACLFGPLLWLDLPEQVWTGRGDFRTIFWYTFGLKTTGTIALAYSLFFGVGITGCFLALTGISSLSNLVVCLYLYCGNVFGNEESKELIGYGFLMWRFQLLGAVLSRADRYVVVALFGVKVLAMFAIGEMLFTIFLKLPNSVLSQLYHAQLTKMPIQTAARWLLTRQPFFFLGYAVCCGLVACVLPWLFPLLFSHAYDESISYAYWFLGVAVASVPTVLTGAVLKSHACIWETKFLSIVIYILTVLVLPFAWWGGVIGLLCGRVVAAIITGACYYWVLIRLAKTNPHVSAVAAGPDSK